MFGLSPERKSDRCSERRQHDRLGQLTFPSHVFARVLIEAPILRQRVIACIRICTARFRIWYDTYGEYVLRGRIIFLYKRRIFTRKFMLRYNSWWRFLGFMPVWILKNAFLYKNVSLLMKLRGSQSGTESWPSTLSCWFFHRSIFHFLLQTIAISVDITN